MEFQNLTPFPALQFESRDEKKQDFGVVALRGTFDIQNGMLLNLNPEQEPLVVADEYFGDPTSSSLRMENCLAPYKPTTDVHVVADAHAPYGRPSTQWNVAVQVGQVVSQLTVTGRRHWQRGVLGFRPSNIQPTTRVPLRYENAFGGAAADKANRYSKNPVGVGAGESDVENLPIPQILPVGYPDPVYGTEIPVAGFGPVAPSWAPRLQRAGTFNSVWQKTRWPDLPEDFSYSFYNSGGTGLTMPKFVNGDEVVKLTNLSEEGDLSFRLPGFELATVMRFEDGRIIPGPIQLDTIHIDTPGRRVYLTWRGVFPKSVPLRALEVRMRAPDCYVDSNV